MLISLLVAASINNVIGRNNALPWHLPNDMKYFKNTTWGMPVIMGRRTFESMKEEPLAGRTNIVITRQPRWKKKGVVTVHNIKDALMVAGETDTKEVFLIGGGEVFREVLPQAGRIYLTRVHTVLEGDVFFPEIDAKKWVLKTKRDCFTDEKHPFDYSFEIWERK